MKTFLFLLSLVFTNLAIAQINYENIPLQEALDKASTEGKLLLIQFEAADCNQCNEVADKGLSNTAVARRIHEAFVPLRISVNHPDREIIGSQYNLTKGFGTLFMNHKGVLIHTYLRTTSSPAEYQKQMDLALEKAGESFKVNELEAAYNKGNKSPGVMEALLLKKQSLGLPIDALLDEYVILLPVDSLQSTRTLLFIAQQAPTIGSRADQALRKDRTVFNKVWYSMNNALRVSINNRIIYKSLTNAIKTKNETHAVQVARFAQSTHSGNPAGLKAYDKNMLRFYEESGDTTNYFKKATVYFDRYFSIAQGDSIKKQDSINRARLVHNSPKDTLRNGSRTIVRSSFTFSHMGQYYTNELNQGAWNIYKMTDSSFLLGLATEWATKAMAYFESPEAWHTYACLLYKQGQKQQALTAMNNAIRLSNTRGYSSKGWNEELEKMKNALPIN